MDLITLLINLLIIAIIFTLVLFLARAAPIDEPIKGIIIWVVYVIFVLWAIAFLLGGTPPLLHGSVLSFKGH